MRAQQLTKTAVEKALSNFSSQSKIIKLKVEKALSNFSNQSEFPKLLTTCDNFTVKLKADSDLNLEQICASVFTNQQASYYLMNNFLILLIQTLVFTNTKRLPYKADPLKIYQIDWADWWRNTINFFYKHFLQFQTA